VIGRWPVSQQKEEPTVKTTATLPPDTALLGRLDGALLTTLATTGEVEIAGRRYVTPGRLAATFGVTVRTLARWN
jgi:hypothetical protein